MNELENDWIDYALERAESVVFTLKRLKGVQGPEQGLVGESRSDGQQGHAEAAKPGERIVGEIAPLHDLPNDQDKECR